MDPKALGNQPAVPFAAVEEEVTVKNQFPGLTKRELFAGLCLQGLLANPHVDGTAPEAAVKHADRLIAALAKDGAQ